MKRVTVSKFGLLALFSTSILFAQADGGPDGALMKESDPGIPVADALVKEKCGTCHAPDAKDREELVLNERSTALMHITDVQFGRDGVLNARKLAEHGRG